MSKDIRMSEIDFEFATQDDCLQKMVPSDLRAIISERDRLLKDKEELIEVLELALESHNVFLNSNPPQDAWIFRGVEPKARAVIAKAKAKGYQ